LKPAQIKNHLSIFVNCLIENPTFDSQTKEFLTSRPKEFGSECILSDSFMKKIDKSEVVDNILSFVRFKQNQDLNKKGGTKKKKLTGIAKLDDANFAGSAKSNLCTLILTEGDSAKSLAMSGISVVGKFWRIASKSCVKNVPCSLASANNYFFLLLNLFIKHRSRLLRLLSFKGKTS
jgi:DNA topoisomerase-2